MCHYRKARRIERLRSTLRLACLLVRHDRMERAAAGEVVKGISEETLYQARAQAAVSEAKLRAEQAEERRRAAVGLYKL